MKSFSLNRFGKMLCWVLRVNMRSLLAWAVGSVGAVFMGELMAIKMAGFNTPYSFLSATSQMGSVILVLVSLIMVSSVVSTINEKRKREAFMMLPATNLEKYLALIIYTSVVCMVCLTLAFVLGDCLRMLWFWISPPKDLDLYSSYDGETLYYWWSSVLPLLVRDFTPDVLVGNPGFEYTAWYIAMELVVVAGMTLWIHSLMTLGGTLLRKYAFIITGAFFILCLSLFVKFVSYYEISMFTSNWEKGKLVTQEVGTLAYVLAVVLPLFAIFNYWASFRIFKGFQLITNKWTNYDFHK
jgi:uncharacterized membrane protein YidH (DUF202 family)